MDGFARRLGVRTVDANEGTARLAFEATDEHLNPAGTVHGGVLATLVDTAMGMAARTTADSPVPATSQLTIAYLSPGKPGTMSIIATVRKRGEHLLVCEAEIQQDEKALVHAVATFALLSGR